jgi:DNA-directed RNA polymerase specialized sigma24 family protein
MLEGHDDEDIALLRAWVGGDRAAGARLFERHYPRIARYFHNKVSEVAQEDLTHETFLAVLAGAERFRGEARFKTSPIVTAVQHQEQQLLLEALRRIPKIHQVALELHLWKELTAAEIGIELGVPLGTAKTRIRDGRLNLIARLRELARSPEASRDPLDDPGQ